MENLEKSELVISRILSLLMDWGIQHCDLKFGELELEKDYLPFFIPSVDWLHAEGIMRSSEVCKTLDGGGVVLNPVLSSYGFSLLDAMIEIEPGRNKRVADAVRDISTRNRSLSQAGDFIGGLLGGLTKSLGS